MAPPKIQNADLDDFEEIEKVEAERARANGDDDGASKTLALPLRTKEVRLSS